MPPTAVPVAPGRWSIGSIVAVVLVVLVVSGGSSAAAWYLIHRTDDSAATRTAQAAVPPSAVQPAAVPTTSPADPASALSAQVESDRAAAQNLVGRWVPQLSSKAVGMDVDGVHYDEAAILQDFRTLAGRYPGAVLVRSSDYSSFKRGGLWVVLADAPYDDAAAANAWCDDHGIARDGCYAKRLSTTDGPAGNTVLR